jgi:peroxiredoxin
LQYIATASIIENKTVVVFAVTGAFTCPHSPIQLLGYNKYAPTLSANRVDEILCAAVNDPFSLAAWSQEEGTDQVHFIPDMTGDFTRAMGMMRIFLVKEWATFTALFHASEGRHYRENVCRT